LKSLSKSIRILITFFSF